MINSIPKSSISLVEVTAAETNFICFLDKLGLPENRGCLST